MELEITNESKIASFQCDTGIDNLTPESATEIFDEYCHKSLKLSEELPSAKLETENGRRTFSVEHLPVNAATYCYKCSSPGVYDKKELPSQNSNACTVKIKVSAANVGSAAATSATTGVVSALVLGSGISLFFSLSIL
ncbi:SAG-related sequence SRS52D [Toxoplasma gondii GT1]|uniref:SAG-related sequence SRS52D n=4 Tax=Toxoplasma gondii TaxID=5811 RepID=S7W1H2_TOXGG|nr:SAG-related sequence SRS52D [Toxoplasma gondii GT1]KAF4639647.1 SAG-related sequence SRS52D [Toxoplasma gondii]KFG49579.1 SAG-related sequence SRS52D [Toxoplasma gondii p89]KFH02131.1 SAG-related sequence SRS52D [Toxoplasma gondii VAND]